MSQSDSFIDEVTEEVRRDRLFAYMKRYGWIAGVLVVVIVAGSGWNEYRKARDRAEAETFGNALLAALEQDEPAGRVTALDTVAPSTAEGGALRDMMQAAEAASADDTEAAVALLNGVAANGELPVIYRALAKYRALSLDAAMEPAAKRAEYESLAAPGAPLRLLALEQIALTHVAEGDTETAVQILSDMQDEAGMSADLRRRTSQLIVTLGGAPDGDAAPAADTQN